MGKITVIGSNSFSGSNFISHALAQGSQVLAISRSIEQHPVFLPYRDEPLKQLKNFKFIAADINQDLDFIIAEINRFKSPVIVNFAAQSMVAQSWQQPEHWFQTNLLATVKLHDRLRHSDFLERYIHISTPEVYGQCGEEALKESTQYQPSTPYAVSRAAADMSLMSFFRAYEFPVIFTRAANVYGPRQALYRIIPKAIISFLTKRRLKLHGAGRSQRAFIHIDDVSRGVLAAIALGAPPEVYHFSNGPVLPIRHIVESIAKLLHISLEDYIENVEDRLGKDTTYNLNCDKAKLLLGWKPQISLEKGLIETISWAKKNLDFLLAQPLEYIHKP